MKKTILLLAIFICFTGSAQNVVTQYTTVNSGTITIADTQQDILLIQEAAAAVSLTIAFPATPADGQKVSIVSTGGITTASMTASIGTIVNSLIGMTPGTPATYIYYKTNNKWYKCK